MEVTFHPFVSPEKQEEVQKKMEESRRKAMEVGSEHFSVVASCIMYDSSDACSSYIEPGTFSVLRTHSCGALLLRCPLRRA